jgi:hypothetical protein
MTANPTDVTALPSDCATSPALDGYEERIATEIMRRLVRDWDRLQKPGAAIPETEGWFPPGRPGRGCEDC